MGDYDQQELDVVEDDSAPLETAGLDRTFTFLDGTVVELDTPNPLTLEHIVNNEAGKPSVPKVAVTRLGHKRHELNPDDPDYKLARAAWQASKEKKMLLYIVTYGVKTLPPEEETDQLRMFLPEGATDGDLKYMWISQKLESTDELTRFINEVTGQIVPTEEGIAESEAAFPSNRQPAAD